MTAAHAQDFEKTDAYFDALEDAVLQTPRGRWFLNEFRTRCRSTDYETLMNAVDRLGQTLTENRETAAIETLRRELQEMSTSIMQTRREIASIKPTDSGHNKIVAATEELDEIVRSTEQATAEILTAAERVQQIASTLAKAGTDAALCSEIEEHTTNMMLACSFQDLTGQRTSKVVKALQYIEHRVNSMIEIWGITAQDACHTISGEADPRADAHLLNGPAKLGQGVSQDDIDLIISGQSVAAPAASRNARPDPARGAAVSLVASVWSAKTKDGEPEATQAAPGGVASQDDIDALFAN